MNLSLASSEFVTHLHIKTILQATLLDSGIFNLLKGSEHEAFLGGAASLVHS